MASVIHYRESVSSFPSVIAAGSINLVDTPFWVVDRVNEGLLFNDDATMLGVVSQFAALRCLARDRECRIEYTITRVDLKGWLIRNDIEANTKGVRDSWCVVRQTHWMPEFALQSEKTGVLPVLLSYTQALSRPVHPS